MVSVQPVSPKILADQTIGFAFLRVIVGRAWSRVAAVTSTPTSARQGLAGFRSGSSLHIPQPPDRRFWQTVIQYGSNERCDHNRRLRQFLISRRLCPNQSCQIATPTSDATVDIQEVSNATDYQAAATEEVASMIDAFATDLAEMADEMDAIATANEEQTAQIREIATTVSLLDKET